MNIKHFYNKGVLNIILSTIFFTLMAAVAKKLNRIPFFEITFFRAVISAFLCGISIKKSNLSALGENKKFLLLRGFSGAFSLLLYFLTIQEIPFTLAATLQYLSPVFAVFIGVFFLKETLRPAQWGALGITVLAIPFIADFNFSKFSVFYLLGIVSALFSAIAYSSIRKLRGSEAPQVIIFYFAICSLILSLPLTIKNWITPDFIELFCLIMIGIFAQIAQYFLTVAYQSENSSKISGFNYLGVVWATILSVTVWDESLSLSSYLGVALIVLGSIFSAINLGRDSGLKQIQKTNTQS